MDVVRLHPNHAKSSNNGSLKEKLRLSAREQSFGQLNYNPDSSTYSSLSVMSADGGSGSNHHILPNRTNSNPELNQRSASHPQQHYKFGTSGYVANEIHGEGKTIFENFPATNTATLPTPLPTLPTRTTTISTGTSTNMNTNTDAEHDVEVVPKEGMKNADTQTRAFNMMKIYLPGIKEHKQWRAERADPFIEVRKY